MGFAMSQVTWRRANELRNLVTVLKFSAIDFDDRPRVMDQRLGESLDCTCFPRPSGTQKEKIGNRASRSGHPCQIHLIHVDDLLNGFVLPYNHLAERTIQRFGITSRLCRIQSLVESAHWPLLLSATC